MRPSHCPATSHPPRVCFCRYWHRSLNPRKLIEVKFSHLSRNMTMQRTMKLYRLPEVGANRGHEPSNCSLLSQG